MHLRAIAVLNRGSKHFITFKSITFFIDNKASQFCVRNEGQAAHALTSRE